MSTRRSEGRTAAEAPDATATPVPAAEWQPLAAAHGARADALTAAARRRRAARERHPIDDFLYDYYGVKPSLLRRWHPGADVVIGGTDEQLGDRRGWRWYGSSEADSAGVRTVALDRAAFLADRGETVTYVRSLLSATADRPAFTGCLGLHEWAMVYRQDDERRRHTLPLRLGRAGTDAVVEEHQLRCTHFDAFRFFTPDGAARNRLQPTRSTQPDLEQPGCLHANMDLLKWALKLGPAVPGDLLLDTFELARDVRTLDMQASPYDVSSLGQQVVAIETSEGKAEYVGRQRAFATLAQSLRLRLIGVCTALREGLELDDRVPGTGTGSDPGR